ncbi:phosphoglucomutase/phosphomannomutase, alpha/beta/alpha domain III protein [Streptococcus constellatus subsp. pharyngis SK1060 = CCUG 46377]|uniref:Phosphoglucomutase/phosphomannomutase, alpha/beta/alpha domain III protein n=1 Tax=Streptococcus constellatus subsp. pharyngis SK1060 = CCUG 46377 TaxID=1035184 RepID=F9P5C9_STRCV|nr:phosphoglucomutase/phosphomannomutase, alpha/beta/alpha domain III protein [Streptococcus constellatus subsp. pharyngis SK1060 = CCUG 46377]
MLSYYIFSQRSALNNLPENPVMVKSIVTGDLSRAIAKKYGIETVETLTGFKNICGKANEYDRTKEKRMFSVTKKVSVSVMEHLLEIKMLSVLL